MSNRWLIELLMINKCFAKLYYYGKYFRKCAARAYGWSRRNQLCVLCFYSLFQSLALISHLCIFCFFAQSFSFVFRFVIVYLFSDDSFDYNCDTVYVRVCIFKAKWEWKQKIALPQNMGSHTHTHKTMNWNTKESKRRYYGIYASWRRLIALCKTYGCNYFCNGRIFFLGILLFFCFHHHHHHHYHLFFFHHILAKCW